MGHDFIPVVRQRVRIWARPGVFLVLETDHEDKMAYVVRADSNEGGSSVESVPFGRLSPVDAP
jgi:hypothetical protein